MASELAAGRAGVGADLELGPRRQPAVPPQPPAQPVAEAQDQRPDLLRVRGRGQDVGVADAPARRLAVGLGLEAPQAPVPHLTDDGPERLPAKRVLAGVEELQGRRDPGPPQPDRVGLGDAGSRSGGRVREV